MKVLHVYPKSDSLIERHVTLLAEGMRQSAEVKVADNVVTFKKFFREMEPDIVHCHGCWQFFLARAVSYAIRHQARVVLTPHGQLEPWVIKRQSVQENISKTLLWQRRTVEHAYAVILLGKFEHENFRKLGWNQRMEIIRNPIITHSITSTEMAQKTYTVYRKVLDSNTIELMKPQTGNMLRCFIKAGITGDNRWVTDDLITIADYEQWRHLLCYAHQENIYSIVLRGAHLLNYQVPDIDVHRINSYLPQMDATPKTIQESIGLQYASENDRLEATFRQIRKLVLHRQLTISHLCEIDKELREHDVEEDHLAETLRDDKLYKMACRTMQLLADFTGFDEGFMPVPPLNDRITKQIHQQIYNHLKI